jgi:hypothetical protein
MLEIGRRITAQPPSALPAGLLGGGKGDSVLGSLVISPVTGSLPGTSSVVAEGRDGSEQELQTRVRARLRRTGESYTAALRHLRRIDAKEHTVRRPERQAAQPHRLPRPAPQARRDVGRVWAVSEFFVLRGEIRFVIGCGSSVPEEDEELFAAIARRFELRPEDAPGQRAQG